MADLLREEWPYLGVQHPVVAFAKDYPSGHENPAHVHPTRAQLLYGVTGVMRVGIENGVWVCPRTRAVWIPPGVPHWIRMRGKVAMRTLYLDQSVCEGMPEHCTVVAVSPLLRELILAAVGQQARQGAVDRFERLVAVILDELRYEGKSPLRLPMPLEARVRKVADGILKGLDEDLKAEDWAKVAAVSVRTLHRLFLKETGLTFRKWREQARMLEALQRLAIREKVTAVAMDVGYSSVGAFSTAFKKEFGVSPGEYFGEE